VLADAFREVATAHRDEPDVEQLCRQLASQCDRHAELVRPFAARYGAEADDEPERLHNEIFTGVRSGGLGLLRDLHDLYLVATECDLCWTIVRQAARAVRDDDLAAVVATCEGDTAVQMKWLTTRIKQAAPQALVVA
jgi:hypothetical protein